MNLPPEFISNIQNTFGEQGHAFLQALPESIQDASARWGLTGIQPAPTLSYNFVAFAWRGDEQVVLKMSVPNREFKSEMTALQFFAGQGACRLIDYDEEKYWMLLERLQPGVMLSTLQDDDEATYIAADLAQKIWRPLETDNLWAQDQSLIRLSDWFDGLKRLRARFDGGTGPFEEKLVERVERSVKDFFLENHRPVLMHGDFHHYNILSSERGWLIIDPKGVLGPACYEVGPFLRNPWHVLFESTDPRRVTERRMDILHEQIGFERERIREWALADAVLSAWWTIEENNDPQHALAYLQMIAAL